MKDILLRALQIYADIVLIIIAFIILNIAIFGGSIQIEIHWKQSIASIKSLFK